MNNQLNGLVKGLAKQAVLTSAGMDSAQATEAVFGALSSTYKLQHQLLRDSLETSMVILLNAITTDVANNVIRSLRKTLFVGRGNKLNIPVIIIGITKYEGEWAFEMTDVVLGAHNEILPLDQMNIEEMILVMEHIERSL